MKGGFSLGEIIEEPKHNEVKWIVKLVQIWTLPPHLFSLINHFRL